jgi:D-alanyl-D-alanine carboxypeptidase
MQLFKAASAAILSAAIAVALSSPVSAATKAETIDAELKRLFPPDLPGAAVLVVKDGVTILNKGYGLANVELNVPIQPDHLFYAASVGKQFTAAGIMKLVEDGKLTVQTPIRKFFPTIPAAWNGITVEHLLHHTSGIANIFTDAGFRRHAFEEHTPQQLLDQAIAMPLLAPVGSAFAYSSANYTLLAMIIEQVSGEKYDAYLARQFFVPLNMTHTHFIQNAGLIRNLVTPYESGPRLAVRWHSTLLFGGGSYTSNNADLARWTAALQGGAVLKAASLKAMDTPLTLTNGKTAPYGYGVRPQSLAGAPYLRSSGDIQGFHAEVVFMPQSQVFVSMLSNSDDTLKYGLMPVAKRIATIAAGMPQHVAVPQTLPDSVLQQRAGVYKHGKDQYTFDVKDGQLQVAYPVGAKSTPLLALSPTEFYYPDNSDFRIRFITGADGRQSSQWFEIDALDDDTDPVFERE